MKDGPQFGAEPRRRSDVDEHFQAETAVLRLYADGFDKHYALVKFGYFGGRRTAGEVGDNVDDAQRHCETNGHQSNVDADPDELLDPVRLERISLSPLAVGDSSTVTSTRQINDHGDAADN